MAERVGFEPTEPVKAHSISNAANSTTLAPFRLNLMAERVGFEPTVPVKVQQFSRLPDSTTLAPLRAKRTFDCNGCGESRASGASQERGQSRPS